MRSLTAVKSRQAPHTVRHPRANPPAGCICPRTMHSNSSSYYMRTRRSCAFHSARATLDSCPVRMGSSFFLVVVLLLLGAPSVIQADNAKYSLNLTGIESGTGASALWRIAGYVLHGSLTHVCAFLSFRSHCAAYTLDVKIGTSTSGKIVHTIAGYMHMSACQSDVSVC